MSTYARIFAIARPYAARLLLVALLTSMGALAELVEPWVYRAIVNDIAGVFVSRESGLLAEILEQLSGGEGETTEPSATTPATPSTPPTPQPATQDPPPQATEQAPRPKISKERRRR
ncbi:MAG TPA: hypothetical protein VFD30_21300, partial [Terriglobia bacterium]|nr:hypothetical protein [Terriglobia bacterium]